MGASFGDMQSAKKVFLKNGLTRFGAFHSIV